MRNLLIVLFFFGALIPASASAAVVFEGEPGDYYSAFIQDVRAHRDGSIADHMLTDSAGARADYQNTASGDRICQVLYPGSTYDVAKTHANNCSNNGTYCGKYQSPENNFVFELRYQNGQPVWYRDLNEKYYMRRIVCNARILPEPTLTVEKATINAGESTTLTWDAGEGIKKYGGSCTSEGFVSTEVVKGHLEGGGPLCVPFFGCFNILPRWVPDTTKSKLTGSAPVSPTQTTTYRYTCNNENGSASDTVTVKVVPAAPTLGVECSVAPTSALQNQSVTWTATPSGGTGTYTYSWTGTDGLAGTTKTVAKAYGTQGVKTASVTVVSGTQTLSRACSGSLNVSAALQPDLTAGSVTPTKATAGKETTFSGTVTNIGGASTPAGFPNWLVIRRGPNGTGTDVYSRNVSLGALIKNATGQVTGSFTFPAEGQYSASVCADQNAAWKSTVAESNEGNNCGGWTNITVGKGEREVDPRGVRCEVDATTVAINGQTTYRAAGGTSYTWAPSQQTNCTGTANRTCTFPTDGKYVMHVTVNGEQVSCPDVTASVNGGVGSCGTRPELTLTASQDRVKAGTGTFDLDWTISGTSAASCSLRGATAGGVQVYSNNILVNMCSAEGGPVTQSITTQTTYTLTCGTTVVTKTVNVDTGGTEF